MGLMVSAWLLGLVPLGFVVTSRAPRAYRWLALALGISFLADGVTLLTREPWWVSRVYVVSQSALVCAVFLSRKDAMAMLALLVLCGLCAVFLEPKGPEAPLHLIAWFLVVGVASDEAPRPLRRALMTYFGLGAAAWMVYVLFPDGWPSRTWLVFQGTRALGIALFGYACWHPAPELRLT